MNTYDTVAPRLASHHRLRAARASARLALALLPLALAAQLAPDNSAASGASNPPPAAVPPAADLVTLNPFVVDSSKQQGWNATETLAGTRLRTDLKDVPNQIEMFTKDFMDDLGVTDLNQAMLYSANTENMNSYMQTSTGQQINGYVSEPRIRGLAPGTFTRNFFVVNMPTDNYNLDMGTVASGPNAILFSLGAPSGIIDATPSQALMQDKYGFTYAYDSDVSRRVTLDVNQVILKNMLAVRLMALSHSGSSEAGGPQKPSYDRDDRLYAAIKFTPFKYTTINFEAERESRNWDPATRELAYDYVSNWYNANLVPGSIYAAPRPAYNNSTAATTNAVFAAQSTNPVLVFNGSVPLMGWGTSVYVKNPELNSNVNTAFDSTHLVTISPGNFPDTVNPTGTARGNLVQATTKTLIFDQRIAPNFYTEFAWNRENSMDNQAATGGFSTGVLEGVYVDPNQYLPGTTTPNPNFGKLYFDGQSVTTYNYYINNAWRATLSYEYNFAHEMTNWLKWLGRHTFQALYQQSELQGINQGFARLITGNPSIPGDNLTPTTTAGWGTNPTRLPNVRYYFNSPYTIATPQNPIGASPPGSSYGNWSLTDANGNSVPLALTNTGLFSPTSGKPLAGRTATTGSLTTTDSPTVVWQGFFLPDSDNASRLILTWGYREDHAEIAKYDIASITKDTATGLFPTLWSGKFAGPSVFQSGVNRNLSAVIHPLKWLTAYYDYSTTFNIPDGTYDAYGIPNLGANGNGHDVGLRFDLWKNKLSLRINNYETVEGPVRAVEGATFATDVYTLENRVETLEPGIATINPLSQGGLGLPSLSSASYEVVENLKATGYELELDFTPMPNWNIRINGAKPKAYESNIGAPFLKYVAQRLPVWQAMVATNGEVDAAGKPVTWTTANITQGNPSSLTLQQYYNNQIIGTDESFATSADGKATVSGSTGRANLITEYNFDTGNLRGFSIGGAMRWQGRPVIGYGIATSSTGAQIYNLNQVYYGPALTYLDLFGGYQGRLKLWGNVHYHLRLNVSNVLDRQGPIPTYAYTTGQATEFAMIRPREYLTSFSVDF